jgi:monoamine oxidase
LALGAMMHGPGSPEEERLKQLMLADLSYIHDKPLKELEEEFEYMYAFDWQNNPLAMGTCQAWLFKNPD